MQALLPAPVPLPSVKQVRTVIKLSLVADILTNPAPAAVLPLTAALPLEYGFLSSKGVLAPVK